eukprot:134875-Chlamydomonas_euryale.AAC.4
MHVRTTPAHLLHRLDRRVRRGDVRGRCVDTRLDFRQPRQQRRRKRRRACRNLRKKWRQRAQLWLFTAQPLERRQQVELRQGGSCGQRAAHTSTGMSMRQCSSSTGRPVPHLTSSVQKNPFTSTSVTRHFPLPRHAQHAVSPRFLQHLNLHTSPRPSEPKACEQTSGASVIEWLGVDRGNG